MELVIDIPEVFYEYCKAQEDAIEIQLAVKNGIPLPEGAEILSKEAYSDLCMRAANHEREGMK